MQPNNIFTINWKNVLGSLISAMIMAGLTYLSNVVQVTDFGNHAILGIAVAAALTSLIKSFGTNDSTGKFLGILPVK